MQDRRIYVDEVKRLTGIKTRKTLYAHMDRGILPKPVQINGKNTWLLSEVCAAYQIPVEGEEAA